MVRLASVLSLASFALFAVATPVKRDQATIQADITEIAGLIDTWEESVLAFSGTSKGASAITNDSATLKTAFLKATNDTLATANLTTDMDGLLVLGQLENSSVALTSGLTQIAEKRADFQNLTNGLASIEATLNTLGAAATGFIGAIGSIIPDAGVVAQAVQFQTTWSAAFGDAISDLQTGL